MPAERQSQTPMTRARASAMGSLAMREHSVAELRSKLLNKQHDPDVVETVLADLQAENLLSNERFASSYWRVRTDRGYGTMRIRQELQLKGIAADMIQLTLEDSEIDFHALVRSVYEKKYRGKAIMDFKDKQKRQAFLYRRGFDAELIRTVVGD